jgi:oxaloacetate decarboxylase alpha subunit
MDKLRKECEQYAKSDEDVLSYAQFPQVATKFFEKRRDKELGIDADHIDRNGKTLHI